jgi:hypothetical protein
VERGDSRGETHGGDPAGKEGIREIKTQISFCSHPLSRAGVAKPAGSQRNESC